MGFAGWCQGSRYDGPVPRGERCYFTLWVHAIMERAPHVCEQRTGVHRETVGVVDAERREPIRAVELEAQYDTRECEHTWDMA